MGLLLFGISFGYVEAAVVYYLRTIHEPARALLHPDQRQGDVFPLATRDQLEASAPQSIPLLKAEVVREAATLLMLAGVALVATGDRNRWLPAFAIAFGTWDLFYYVFLKVLVDWPASLLTWDILFLVPVPWAAPVLAPVIVALTIIVTGLIALRRPVRMNRLQWSGLALGGFLIVLSFMWDYRNIMAGGLPNPFAWGIFSAGEAAGVLAFVDAWRKSRTATRASHESTRPQVFAN